MAGRFDKVNDRTLAKYGQPITIITETGEVPAVAIIELPAELINVGRGEIVQTASAIIIADDVAAQVQESAKTEIRGQSYKLGKHLPDGLGMTRIPVSIISENTGEGGGYGY